MEQRSVLVCLELDQGLNPVAYWLSVQGGSKEVAVRYSRPDMEWPSYEALAVSAHYDASRALVDLGWWR